MKEITAEQARNLSIDESRFRLPQIYAKIKNAAKDEENLIEIAVRGSKTRETVTKELEIRGFKVTNIEGAIIHIEW